MSENLRCPDPDAPKFAWERVQTALENNWALIQRVIATSGVPALDVDAVANDVFLKVHSWYDTVSAEKLEAILKTEASTSHYFWRCAANAAIQWHRENQKSLRHSWEERDEERDEKPVENVIADHQKRIGQRSMTKLDELIEEERERNGVTKQDEALKKTRLVLQELKSGGGKQLALALIRYGKTLSFCSDPGDTLLWIRWYVYSDYPRNFKLKRAEVTKALLQRNKWTRGQLDLNNKRLKEQFARTFENHFHRKPVEGRRSHTKEEEPPKEQKVNARKAKKASMVNEYPNGSQPTAGPKEGQFTFEISVNSVTYPVTCHWVEAFNIGDRTRLGGGQEAPGT